MSHRIRCAHGLLIALAASSLVASRASAQQPLEEFLEAARSRALDVREARAALDQAEWQTASARGRLLPILSAQGTYQRNQYPAEFNGPAGPVVITPADALSATFTATLPVIDISSWARLVSSGAMEDATSARLGAVEDEVEASVVALWHQLVAARAFVTAAERTLAAAGRAREAAAARVEVGVAPTLDLARADAEQARARQTVAETQLGAVLAAKNLADLTGLEPNGQPVELDADLAPELPLARFVERARTTPAVRAAEEGRRAAEIASDLAWTTLLPVVSAFARETGTNASGFTGETWSYAVGLTATWQLDLVRTAQIGESGALAEIATIAAERAAQQAETGIHELWHRVETARTRVEAANAALEASRRAADDARARNESGTGTQLDQIQAERDLFQAEVARIQAIADLRVARAALLIRAGRP